MAIASSVANAATILFFSSSAHASFPRRRSIFTNFLKDNVFDLDISKSLQFLGGGLSKSSNHIIIKVFDLEISESLQLLSLIVCSRLGYVKAL
ncbi:hypothetical protein RchiOBHm_Chr3g0482371 [Rosa chinensis]|uniref:Uncharacterized protein n=1 Tax=Rosa chinensis TaxID=74649 RepID=A0A2P6RE95_ROSCH|nr:hypothetical protein RchiOBHm_Chr3g0482371 [Rosa chinensis]